MINSKKHINYWQRDRQTSNEPCCVAYIHDASSQHFVQVGTSGGGGTPDQLESAFAQYPKQKIKKAGSAGKKNSKEKIKLSELHWKIGFED